MRTEGSIQLHRAIRLTLPAAALFSIPFGVFLQASYWPSLGFSISSIPESIWYWGTVLLCAVTLLSSSFAIGACSKAADQRPAVLAILWLLNLFAMMTSSVAIFSEIVALSMRSSR